MTNISLATGSFPVQSIWSNATDACESSSITFNGTPGNQADVFGAAIAPVDATASDSLSGQPLTYSAAGLPAGLAIDAATGVVTGTPTEVVNNASVVIAATDALGISASTTVKWTISPARPTITTPPISSPITYGDALRDATLSGGTATIGTTTVPGSFAFTDSAAIPGAGTQPESVTFTPVNQTDYASATGTIDVTVYRAKLYVIPNAQSITFGQIEPNDTFTLRTTPAAPSSAVRRPSDARYVAPICKAAAYIVDAPTLPSHQTIACSGGSDANYTFDTSATAQLTVVNAIEISVASRANTPQSASARLTVRATDLPQAQPLVYSATGLPRGLSINRSTGEISGRISGVPGTYEVRITATDATGAHGTKTIVWHVEDDVVLTRPATRTTLPEHAARLRVTARDLIAHRRLHYSASGLPRGLAINARTGVISGTVTAHAGTYRAVIVVTDSHGARASTTFTWRVG
jgi:hypothetical protein